MIRRPNRNNHLILVVTGSETRLVVVGNLHLHIYSLVIDMYIIISISITTVLRHRHKGGVPPKVWERFSSDIITKDDQAGVKTKRLSRLIFFIR